MVRVALLLAMLVIACTIPLDGLGARGWSLKPGVTIGCSHVELLDKADIVRRQWPGRAVITRVCADEGDGPDGTAHAKGLAFDVRFTVRPDQKRVDVALRLRRAFGPGAQVLVRGDHYHVEVAPPRSVPRYRIML